MNPNIGFACALLAWQSSVVSPPHGTLAFELAAEGDVRPLHCEHGLDGAALLSVLLRLPADALHRAEAPALETIHSLSEPPIEALQSLAEEGSGGGGGGGGGGGLPSEIARSRAVERQRRLDPQQPGRAAGRGGVGGRGEQRDGAGEGGGCLLGPERRAVEVISGNLG